ncbi:MAG: betaine/proline/choline family ABC transporter ATP-binding protein [Emergencia timonensis]|uniref:betaine/proline/choline family ABC transporter ATP-binding protein n=1 Tax=Emergencia timonensis TaxID=1776384 RepID=UPI00082B62B1|nr:ABC transporter ATP-binding protein [Emergencia timonensis]WNX87515.1 ABC transporter ATP-binding protein [Emergencia timonensis]
MIQFRDVTKDFKGNVVLSDISMEIKDKELTVLIGPSGCGKTTTLKMINRLIQPSKGNIFIDGKNIEEMDKVQLRRNMGYVIQQGGLFPHMTIRQNIEIIERLEKKDPQAIVDNTVRLMKMVDLNPEAFLDRYPTELSGGQRQRIGVIRALANDPDIVLLDEPFSALDPVTRSSLQDELIELQAKVGKTMVFVTHDMDEAIKIADRICIMKDGHILQYDTPEMILKKPVDEFVSNFVGTNRIWDSPEYIRVEDFMISHPITCKGDMIRNRCIKRMRDHHIDTLLVVDEENKLRGIVGRKDLFKATRPLMPAEDIMHDVAYVAHVGDSIVNVLKMVEESEVNNIPVLDQEERLVGLLTNSNLVSTLSKQFLTDDNTEGMVIEK